MANLKIRIALLENGIKQWELAKMLGVSEMTIVRRLRNELPEEEQARYIRMIENYSGERRD